MMHTGEHTEHSVEVWLQRLQAVSPIRRPYIWPGSWPDRDLADMALALPGWQYDSAWIWYQRWDPEIPDAVQRFNQHQPCYTAQSLRSDSVYQPPVTLVAVLDRADAAQTILAMWLKLGERNDHARA